MREQERKGNPVTKDMNADLVGTVAGALTTIAFVPQAWRIWKTRAAQALSLSMYLDIHIGRGAVVFSTPVARAWPIIVCNGVTLLLAGTVLAMKLKFG